MFETVGGRFIAIGAIPMFLRFLFPIYGILFILRSRRLDDFEKWMNEGIPGKYGCRERGDIIGDIYAKILFIGWGLMLIGLIINVITEGL